MQRDELEAGLELAPQKMKLKTKLLITAAALAVLCIAVLASFLYGAVKGAEKAPAVITSDLLGEQLRSVQELTTVAYYYTNMGRFENQVDFYGWKVPFTTKSFIISYDGVIKAGVDLTKVSIAVDEAAKTVSVTLPGSQILSHEIPEDSLEVFDESDNIFNRITIEDYAGFTKDQKALMEQRAIDNGLLTGADEKARDAVSAFLSLLPDMEAYTLTVPPPAGGAGAGVFYPLGLTAMFSTGICPKYSSSSPSARSRISSMASMEYKESARDQRTILCLCSSSGRRFSAAAGRLT